MRKLCLLLFVLLSVSSCQDKTTKTPKVNAFVVKPKTTEQTLFFSGEIRPIKEDAVTSPAQATVKDMFFSYGMRVKKGQVLVSLDSPEMQRKYDEALTAYLTAKDTYDVANAKYAGTKKLWESGLIAKNIYEAEISSLHNNEIGLIKAKNHLADFIWRAKGKSIDDLAQLSLSNLDKVRDALKEKYNRIELQASLEGVTLQAPKNTKGPLRVGSQINEADVVTLIGDMSGLAIKVKVPEISIDKIKKGMKAKVTGVAFPNFTLEAEVAEVNAEAINTQGGSGLPQFNALIIVPKLTEAQRDVIRVGMSAAVEVSLGKETKLMIPVESLIQKQGKTWVKIQSAQGKINEREIKTGRPTPGLVTVTQGLTSGEKVVWDEPEEANS